MWLSIIIPVYNAEKYLTRCLDSVLAAWRDLRANEKSNGESSESSKGLGKKPNDKPSQKLEVLLVDNNSTDRSSAIIAAYHQKYPQIVKLFACTTPGAAAARNFGARQAQGDYLWFIDADDYIDPSTLTRFHRALHTTHPTPDLLMFGAQKINRDGQPGTYLTAVTPDEPDYKSRFVRYGLGPWQVIIRRRWWQKHRFAFREGMIHEDMELMSSLILFTDHFAAVDAPLYFYCDNPESVLHQSQFKPQIFDIFPALTGLWQRFAAQNATEQYYAELEWFFIWNLLIDAAADFRAFPEGRSGFRRARQMLRQYFPHWRRNRFLRQKSLKLRLRVRFSFWGI